MHIEIEARSGFCFGVKRAIELAEKIMNRGNELYCLGQIVHNEAEEERLTKLGMKQICHSNLKSIAGKTVLIRAHGEPPETFRQLEEFGIEVIDATCPVVLKLQLKIKKISLEMPEAQIVIYGKAGHPEVIGLEGQTGYRSIVVDDNESDLEQIDMLRPVVLFSQTTKSLEGFHDLAKRIRQSMKSIGADPFKLLTVHDTICRQVSNRNPALKQFAEKHDVVIFVSGANSSNGRYLWGIAREVNPRSFLISSKGELQKEWFEGARSIGVSGATSTPLWQMEEVANAIEELY